jgi:putative addiction module component (TIGR02574 family)
MSSIDLVLTAAMQLDRPERADVARQLIASLDGGADAAEPDVEAAWLAEVERRMAGADAGTAQFEPWEAVEERIATRLRGLRR